MEFDFSPNESEADFYVQSGSRSVGVFMTLLGNEGVQISLEDKGNPMNVVIPIPLRKPDFSRPKSKYEYLSQLIELKETTQKVVGFVFHFFQEKAVYTEIYQEVAKHLKEKELWIFPDFSKDRQEEKKRMAAAFQREKQLFEEKMAPVLLEKGIEPSILLGYLLNAMRSHPDEDTSYFISTRKRDPFRGRTTWVG